MEEGSAGRERSRDLDRLLTFIDAIVAIAITLLVLPLVDLARNLPANGSVSHLLSDHMNLIGAFLLSFAVIANLWLVQHRVLHHVAEANDALTLLLVLWSLTIVVIPFPTALLSATNNSSDQPITKVLYVGTMAVSSFLLSLVSVLVARNDDLLDGGVDKDTLRSFIPSATFAVALTVMLLAPSSSYWPLLLLVVSERSEALWRRRVRRRRTA